MGRVVTIIAIVAAFVAGTIVTGAAVDAAQGDEKGKPFQELVQNTFSFDSFFDVFYKIDFSSTECGSGEIPKLNEDLSDTNCSSDYAVDSFFDIFYRIERDTQTNTNDIGQIQTEIVALELRSLPQPCLAGEIAKWDGSAWTCAPDVDTDTDTLGTLSCSTGEVAKWTGSAWECAADADTTYSGADFALSGQSCLENEVVTGIDANGNLVCGTSGSTCVPSTEVCSDGIDNDCDGLVDLEDQNCQCIQQCDLQRQFCASTSIPSSICDDNYNTCINQCQ